jgi:biotin carboxyl carrier protein
MQPKYRHEGREYRVTPLRRGGDIDIAIDEHRLRARLLSQQGNRVEISVDGVRWAASFAQDGSELFVHLGGRTFRLQGIDEFGDQACGGNAGEGQLLAPMPGVVMEVFATEGQRVAAGDGLMLIESMKLQTEIRARIAGTVSRIAFTAGASFERSAVLVEIEGEAVEEVGS